MLLDDLGKLFADDGALPRLAGENRIEVSDVGGKLFVLVDELLPLKCSKPAKLHLQNGVGLNLVNAEQLHQALASNLDGRTSANERDDVVEPLERGKVSPDDVRALFALAKAIARATDDDLDLMRDPVPDERIESERARHVVDERHHVATEGVLQLGVLVKVVQHNLGDRVALQHNDKPLTGTR